MLGPRVSLFPAIPCLNSSSHHLSSSSQPISPEAVNPNSSPAILPLCSSTRQRKVGVLPGASLMRVPMETAGAYQLVQEETGEKKFIVWGDAADSPIPSQQVLSWKPPSPTSQKKHTNIKATGDGSSRRGTDQNDKPLARNANAARSFGRLKTQKLKGLMKRSSQQSGDATLNSRKSNFQNATPDTVSSRDLKHIINKRTTMRKGNLEEKRDTYFYDVLHKQDLEESERSMPAAKGASGLRRWGSADTVQRNSSVGQLQHQRKLHSDTSFFSRISFKDIGCSDDMLKALKSQSFLRPSHIQAKAYVPVLDGKSCIIADQSGSGKTLAYLAPIIQRLRQEEKAGLGKSLPGCPRVVILVPTAELAAQVLNCCRSISKSGAPFRSMVATGGFRQKTQLDGLQQEVDVLIATPGRFNVLLGEGFVKLTNLKSVVLDEVDILFGDEDFEEVLQSLINSARVEAQYLFVTATLPVEIYNKLVRLFPDCEVTMGPGVHRTSSRLEEVLVDCSGEDGEEKNQETAFQNKRRALLQLAGESPVPKTIVFCNKIETCRKVENVLKRFDKKGLHIKVLPFHAAITQEVRLSNIDEFLNTQSQDSHFLVCTDRASRGIDFINVDHVVLFDYPRDPSEYVRRVGRTARGAGGKGKAFIFVVGKQVSLARKILERNSKGHPLHDVPLI